MTALWTLSELLQATDGEARNAPADLTVTSVSIDTRTLEPGALFFAIRGVSQDGHHYVKQAFDAGAALCVVEADKLPILPDDMPYLVVEDTLEAMRALARAARSRMGGKVVGVTGSVGKTSAKEMLRATLSVSGPTHAPDKSFNNHWGVPLTAARMPAGTQYGVFEIGMSSAGEITPLTQLVRPDVAIITTVAAVHLEFFDSVEGIADAKAEIFEGLSPDGKAVINHDNPYYERLLNHALKKTRHVYSFGTHEKADARLIDLATDQDGSDVTLDLMGETLRFRLAIPGSHQVMNALAVLLAVRLIGADVAGACAALGRLKPTEGRGAREQLKSPEGARITLIDESYNANPASMRAALAVLESVAPENGGRRIAVLGDMLELGADAGAMHAELAEVVRARNTDLVFACGPEMKKLYDALPKALQAGYASTSVELAPLVLPHLRHGDVVMVKGSNGVRMRRIIERLREEFAA